MIIVCNKKPDVISDTSKVEFVSVDFPVPRSATEPPQDLQSTLIDKASKYTVGLIHAQRHKPDYIMFFDSDDLIHHGIATYVNARPGYNGWFINKGYTWKENVKIGRKMNRFNLFCGTSHIINMDLFQIPEGLCTQSNQKDIIAAFNQDYFLHILGSHRFTEEYYVSIGRPLLPYPKRAAIWVLETGENRLGRKFYDTDLRPMLVTKRFANAFGIAAPPRDLSSWIQGLFAMYQSVSARGRNKNRWLRYSFTMLTMLKASLIGEFPRKESRVLVVTGKFPIYTQTFVVNHITYLLDMGVDVNILELDMEYTPNEINHLHEDVVNYNLQKIILNLNTVTIPSNKIARIMSALYRVFHACFFKPSKFFWFFKSVGRLKNKKRVFSTSFIYDSLRSFEYTEIFKDYDVVHAHFSVNAFRLLPFLKESKFKGKFIVSLHGYDMHGDLEKCCTAVAAEIPSTQFVVNSRYSMYKTQKIGLLPKQISIIPVFTNAGTFSRENGLRSTRDCVKVLFVGRLIEFKAPLLAIQIVERARGISNLKWSFTIIGNGQMMEECRNYINANGLEEFTYLNGAQSYQTVKKEMQNSDIFLFPGIVDKTGRCENQGIVIQEAQLMELPVLVSNVGGIKEGMIDGKTGFVVEEKDINGFGEKLLLLAKNPNLREKMGTEGRKYVQENYDPKVLGKQILDLYFA